MRKFILDVNVTVDPTKEGYPTYFFDELKSKGRIVLVIGGTKYRNEAKANSKLMDIFGQLISAGRLLSVDDDKVDGAEEHLKTQIIKVCKTCPKDCDDPHIFALALVSNCLNVITNDKRIAKCRDKVRNKVGHDVCANVKVISSEATFKAIA